MGSLPGLQYQAYVFYCAVGYKIGAKSVIAHLKLLVRGVWQTCRTVQAIATALGFPAVTL